MSTMEKMMMAVHMLDNASSILAKQTILADVANDMPEFKDMLVYALDPYRKYGIKQIPPIESKAPIDLRWVEAVKWLEQIQDLSGNRLKEAVQVMLGNRKPKEKDLLKRILLKDLRCGVGATLVNKVFPGLIPEFGVMLASPLEEKHIKKLQSFQRVYGQAKKNGDRCVVICEQGKEPEVLSRKGHAMLNYTKIAASLEQVRHFSGYPGIVFDGEVICGDFFKTRGTKKKAGNEAEDAVFHCFDVVLLPQWKAGKTDLFQDRYGLLKTLSRMLVWKEVGNLKRVRAFRLDIYREDAWSYLEDQRDALIEAGEEGLMIRPNLPYNFSTRSSLYKFKKMDTMDCPIKEVLLGEEGKKHGHHAGSVLVELDNGQTCKAGIAGDDSYRDWLWKNRSKVVGQVAEIQYQEKTTNQQGEYKLQFPVMIRIREDKS